MESQEQSQKSEERPLNKVAVIPLSMDLLQTLLPMGSKILAVSQDDYGHTINVLISHPSFDEVPEHELPPRRMLYIRRNVNFTYEAAYSPESEPQ